MVKDREIKDKPLGVRLLAILALALGIVMIIAGASVLIVGSLVMPGNIEVEAALISLAIMFALFVLFFFTIGIGLWLMKGWAKSTYLILAMIGVISDPLRLGIIVHSLAGNKWKISTTETTDIIYLALRIVLALMILWYLPRPKVTSAFEAVEMERTKKKIGALEEKIELARQQCNAGEMTKSELAKIKANCHEEERRLRAKMRHFDKVRLGRERKLKEKAKAKEKAKKDKRTRKEERKVEREEKKSEREEKRAEKKAEKEARKEEEEKEADEEGEGRDKEKPSEEEEGEEGSED